MKRLLPLLLIAFLLALAGCGGDDDSTSSGASGPAGASGAAGSETSGSASYDITVDEFEVDDQATKTQILKDYVADTPSCNAEVDDGFVLTVSATVTNPGVDGSSPLPDLIDKSC